jgi:hypothetical protein
MAACEGFTIGQFCEKCFQNSHMLGWAEGVKCGKGSDSKLSTIRTAALLGKRLIKEQ